MSKLSLASIVQNLRNRFEGADAGIAMKKFGPEAETIRDDGCCAGAYNDSDRDWINHEAPLNGIGPVCKFCDRLIDSHPGDHKKKCPARRKKES